MLVFELICAETAKGRQDLPPPALGGVADVCHRSGFPVDLISEPAQLSGDHAVATPTSAELLEGADQGDALPDHFADASALVACAGCEAN